MATLTLNITECPSCAVGFGTDMQERLTGIPLWYILEMRPSMVVPTVFSCPHCGMSFDFRGVMQPRIEEGNPDHQGLKQELVAWERTQPVDSLRESAHPKHPERDAEGRGLAPEDDRPCSLCGTAGVILWRCDECDALVCDACHHAGDCTKCYNQGGS